MGYTQSIVALGASSSTLSSAPIFIGDAVRITASVFTSTTSASNVTFRGSNADGFQEAIPNHTWSVLTAIPSIGNFALEPGLRWLLVERPDFGVSATSNVTVLLALQVQKD